MALAVADGRYTIPSRATNSKIIQMIWMHQFGLVDLTATQHVTSPLSKAESPNPLYSFCHP